MEENKQRFFKVVSSKTYCGQYHNKVYALNYSDIGGSSSLYYLNTSSDMPSLPFFEYEVEEVFDYIPDTEQSSGQSKQVAFSDSNERVFASGSKRDNADDKPLPFELHPYMLLRYGYHMKTGQLNYGKGNWQLTQPDLDVWESGGRHFAQALLCFQDPELAKELELDQEDHLSALLFFINMLMQNEAKRGIKPNHYFKGKTK